MVTRSLPLLFLLPLALGGCDAQQSGRPGPSDRNARADGQHDVAADIDDEDEGSSGYAVTLSSAGDEGEGGDTEGCGAPAREDACELDYEPLDLARLGDYAPTETAITDCQEGSTTALRSTQPTQDGAPAVHVLGLYQTRDDHGFDSHPMGAGHVLWTESGSNVLVVSAYEPTTWTIELAEGAELDQVIAIGYHEHFIDAPEGIDTLVHTYEQTGCFEVGTELPGGTFPHDDGSALGLVGMAELLAGAPMTSFNGCYDATTIVY